MESYNYNVRDETEQRTAYNNGYLDGTKVKFLEKRINDIIRESCNFPLGSWEQQHAQGYDDALHGLQPVFVAWRLT